MLQTGLYFVARVENGCESLRTQVHVTINSRPNSPVGASPQTFNDYAGVSYLSMNQPNVVWYASYEDAMGNQSFTTTRHAIGKRQHLLSAVIIGTNGCPSIPTAVEVVIVLGVNDF